ncbi:hypothetical protein BT96DRAFT_990244 [Gymnopus androsaceus JB14]|uniref:Uncharacterized protein n=1 Tax=Gymnopus androsaceus JB14 TaxID=1447944 RepID=A0A6A4HYU6_9AGAR|nr:hypothetical protein BT96DRAFT_990244 [Gymnopus androsaceus JB14]
MKVVSMNSNETIVNPQFLSITNWLIPIHEETVELILTSGADREPSVPICICEETVEPVLSWDGDAPPDMNHPEITASQRKEFAEESWEDDLDERVGIVGDKVKIHDWGQLRDEIKDNLKKAKKKSSPLSQINQLLVLQNFANLHLKGFG